MLLVVGHLLVSSQSPPGEHRHGTPAQQNDAELQEVPLTPEVRPALLLHQFALWKGGKTTLLFFRTLSMTS